MKYKIALAACIAGAGAGAGYWLAGSPRQEPAPAAAVLAAPGAPGPGLLASGPAAPPSPPELTARLVNPLERSSDLRATYARFKDSRDPSERNIAYRAWSACFPTFIGPQGQVASLDSVTAGIDPHAPGSASRIEAYSALMGRCKGFSDLPRAELLAETARQKAAASSGQALAPGELAAKYLIDGDRARALATARAVLASRDPAAIDSLREFVNQYLELQVDTEQAVANERPDLRALAFGLAACRMGMECGAGSLTALQQCANSGACSGSVSDRYMQGVAESDRERLERETGKVMQAVAAGDFGALGL